MISDERLRKAAQKVEESMLASLPEPEECEFTPSLEFERKMEKRAHRASHPIRQRILKAAACFLLVVLVGGGGILTFSVEARAAFVGWVREIRDNYFVHWYVGDTKNTLDEDTIYRLTWLPVGYQEISAPVPGVCVDTLFENEEGSIAVFVYTTDPVVSEVYIDKEFTDVYPAQVGSHAATLYLDQRDGKTNVIVWTDEETDIMFLINGHFNKDELVRMAESVQRESF